MQTPSATIAEMWRPPREGLKQFFVRLKGEMRDDNVTLLAAGVAFYAMLAIFPAFIALLLILGLFVDPMTVEQQIEQLATGLPASARETLTTQLKDVARGTGASSVVGFVAALAGALWSSSSGMAGLMKGLTLAYDEEPRPFLKQRGRAVLLTLGALLLVTFLLGLIVVLPVALEVVSLPGGNGAWLRWGRWPLVAIAFSLGLALLYRWAPNRRSPPFRWLTPGAVLGTVLWLVSSGLFSLYVSKFGSYDETYGAIGGVIVLLLWFFLSALCVLAGAELNAELEREATRR